MKNDVVVAMPWRPQPERMKAHDRACEFWEGLGIPVIEADSEPRLPFHRTEARNHAVAKAHRAPGINAGTNFVVIVADADTIPQEDQVRQAVLLAHDHDHVVYPFDRYVFLPQEAAEDTRYYEHEPLWIKENLVGGIQVVRRDTYWALGGMDERFERRWGYEDNAFFAVANTLGTVTRLPGVIYGFDHAVEDAGREGDELNPNYWRNRLYAYAHGNPRLIRELIKR